jgi:DNA-binding MarR family transcriptional regulator
MRKITSIRTERDLAVAVEQTLRSDPDLSWRITRAEHLHDKTRADAVLHLHLDGKNFPFLAEFKLKPTADLIETLAHRAARQEHPWLLVTPRLSDRFVDLCRKSGVACLDLNGRVWIRRGPVLVDRSPSASRDPVFAAPPEPDLFSAKSSRVARAFLAPRSAWTQLDLATITGVSRPLLSRLLEALTQQGFVRREGRPRNSRWTVAQPDALLEEWARRDIWPRRVVLQQYSILSPNLEKAARQLLTLLGSARVAFTQWFAAQFRHPYTEPPVLSAYVDAWPTAETLQTLNTREVTTGGRLWLLRPQDEGVFQFTQTVEDLPLVSDAQIYLDLLQVGLRGPDQAKALRDWEGFRR